MRTWKYSTELCRLATGNMAFVLIECMVCMLLVVGVSLADDFCPGKCVCERLNSNSRSVRASCGNADDPVRYLDELQFGDLAGSVVKLNLSGNHLSNITQAFDLPNLKKLDLSKNHIVFIKNGVFNPATELTKIDLSSNYLSTVSESLFNALSSLKQLDISRNPLNCDCDVVTFAEFVQQKSIKLLSNPTCTYQKSKKVQYLKKTKSLNRNLCSALSAADQGGLQLQPHESQIVFEGDALRLKCQAPSTVKHKATVAWTHHVNRSGDGDGVAIEVHDRGAIVDSVLAIARLSKSHSGNWSCELTSQSFNETRSVMVIVVTNATRYCPMLVTHDNKGSYTWPKTMAGFSIELPCQVNSLDAAARVEQQCAADGTWLHLNTTSCPYVSETTRILEQFSKVNLSLTKVNVHESTMHLKKNYTSDLKVLKDKMDLVYIARTVHNYLEFLALDKELGFVLADIINNLMGLPRAFIAQADDEDGSCTRLVRSVETITEHVPLARTNFAMQELRITRDSYTGLTCSWYTEQLLSRTDAELHCVSANDNWQPLISGKHVEASLQIPASVFQQLREHGLTVTSHRLFVGMYSNSHLFPARNTNASDSYTAVVGTKFVGVKVRNISGSPIYVMLHIAEYKEESALVPVWWDPALRQGRGGWSGAGCQVSHLIDDTLLFHCRHLSYYTVLQRRRDAEAPVVRAQFRASHPAVYIGAFVLFGALLAAIVSHVMFYARVQVARKTKHSLINTWFAVSLLCFMYTFGIYQTEEVRMCRVVGLLVHYFTISTLLWMYVTVSDLYRRLNRSENTMLTDDVLQSEPPIEKPILGVYLIGWGISLIVCGISGAVNIKLYASEHFCFLASASALSAVFVPSAILLLIICMSLMLVRCSIRTTERVAQLSEGTQVTENVDIELLEGNVPSRRASVKSASTPPSTVLDEWAETAPHSNLKANVVSFVVFVLAWMFAAVATTKPLESYFAYEEDLFNILYALCASCFGLFNLFYYCVARADVRTEWAKFSRRKQNCFRNRSVSDTNRNLISSNQVSVETQITSRSSSRSSGQPKSVSRHSNNLKASDLNATESRYAKSQNVDLVVLHRQQYRTNNAAAPLHELSTLNGADLFYNPHQSGVARKFFRKQRRHMMKHNNLGTTARRRDTGGSLNSIRTNKSAVSSNIFGTSSKVNNTNIHVEQVAHHVDNNPNMLSGMLSESDFSCERFELPVKLLNTRKHHICSAEEIKVDNMRTISQQCSLEYSSETLSERILDKELISSVLCEDEVVEYKRAATAGTVYLNPLAEALYTDSRAKGLLRSAVSTSDFDEIYAQARYELPLPRSRSHTITSLCTSERSLLDSPCNDLKTETSV